MVELDIAYTCVQNLTTVASAVPDIWLVPSAHQNINYSRDLTTSLSGMICHLRDTTCDDQAAYQI